MASELLRVPEERLKEVIWVIRAGVAAALSDGHAPTISDETERQLLQWCDDEEEYINDA